MAFKRAFIGTGLIGGGLAEAACGRGDEVAVWNRTREKAEALEAHGARVAGDIADAVTGADFVHITMTKDDAVDALLPDVLAALAPNALLFDHSTTSAASTAARQERLEGQGVAFIDAPVFMSPAACKAAKGIMLACASASVFERAQPAMTPMSGEIYYVGAEPGRAAATKLIGNGMILSLVGGLADVFAVGRPHGVEPSDVLELFRHFDLRWVLEGRGARMAEGDFGVSWTLEMARKDAGLMKEAAGAVPLSSLRGFIARADELIAAGEGDKDVGVLAKAALADG